MTPSAPEDYWIWSILGLGGVLALTLLAEFAALLFGGYSHPAAYIVGVLSSVVAIGGLIYGGHRIATGTLSRERYRRIALWCLAGGATFLTLNLLIMLSVPPNTLLYAVSWVRWALSLGGAAGLLIGLFEARAIERARAAERLRIEQQEMTRQNELLDEFASLVSHDLRNPLNVAQGRIELAREESDLSHLDAAERALDRMEAIIEETLLLAREGQRIGVLRPVPLEQLVTSCWETVDTKGAAIELEPLPTVRADPDRLRHVFENLFRNAIEHGGTDVTVRVGQLPDEDGIFIEDDGPGIPEGEAEDVFQLGYTTTNQGSGFGLSIVRRIVQAHGWVIRLTESDEGGARFEITGVETVHRVDEHGRLGRQVRTSWRAAESPRTRK